jgi:DNA modification methylase
LGDSYNGSGKAGNKDSEYFSRHTEFGKPSQNKEKIGNPTRIKNLKPKDLIGIPWRVAFALQQDGWYLRQDIIWHKPNPMPESVTDRCTKAHEYIFLLAKSQKYYFDNEVIRENSSNIGKTKIRFGGNKYGDSDDPKHATKSGNQYIDSGFRNKRSVWTINTKPFKSAHFATFPEDLIKPCILAGSKKGDVVLDPFFGAGTTGVVAKKHGRDCIGIELNPKYCKMAQRRIDNTTQDMFAGTKEI